MPSRSAQRERKEQIINIFGRKSQDTGSPEVQVALLTDRINALNGHFQKFPKDFHSKRGLMRLVGQRRRALNYLRIQDASRYTKLIGELELRK